MRLQSAGKIRKIFPGLRKHPNAGLNILQRSQDCFMGQTECVFIVCRGEHRQSNGRRHRARPPSKEELVIGKNRIKDVVPADNPHHAALLHDRKKMNVIMDDQTGNLV